MGVFRIHQIKKQIEGFKDVVDRMKSLDLGQSDIFIFSDYEFEIKRLK